MVVAVNGAECGEAELPEECSGAVVSVLRVRDRSPICVRGHNPR